MDIPRSTIWAVDPGHFAGLRDSLRTRLESLTTKDVKDARASEQRVTIDGVEVVKIKGYMDKLAGFPLDAWGWASVSAARRVIDQAARDPEVSGIMMVIDSPGGSVDGLAELGDAVFAARKVKPVIAQIDGMAASAAYYVASQATAIYSHRMDMIGSIGTYMLLYDMSKMAEQQGVEAVLIATGDYKGAGSPGTEITTEQRADFQRIVDAFFADFTAVVDRGRGAKINGLAGLADGRVFMAAEAQASGLIDGVQTFEETISSLRVHARKPSLATAMDVDIRLAEAEGCSAEPLLPTAIDADANAGA